MIHNTQQYTGFICKKIQSKYVKHADVIFSPRLSKLQYDFKLISTDLNSRLFIQFFTALQSQTNSPHVKSAIGIIMTKRWSLVIPEVFPENNIYSFLAIALHFLQQNVRFVSAFGLYSSFSRSVSKAFEISFKSN